MLKHVLVPLDGSRLAEKALPYAKQIVDPRGTITLLSVIDVPEYAIHAFYSAGVVPESASHQMMIDKMIPQTHEYLEGIAERLQQGELTFSKEVVIGEAASSIVEMAEKTDVEAVVMSTHGRSGISRWLFGSVTSKVLGAARCPVFVIPNRNEEA